MVPLLIAPHGGMVGDLPVQRTFATGRSVEFDAVLLAGAPAPAPDALPARDAKAGTPVPATVEMMPPGVTLRILWFPESAMNRLSAESNASRTGALSRAAVAGPPSPVLPAVPVPAMVVIEPSWLIRRTAWSTESAT